MGGEGLRISTGCIEGHAVCAIEAKLTPGETLGLTTDVGDAVPCDAVDGGYVCGDHFLPIDAAGTVQYLPGDHWGTLRVMHDGLSFLERVVYLPAASRASWTRWESRLLERAVAIADRQAGTVTQVGILVSLAEANPALRNQLHRAGTIAQSLEGAEGASAQEIVAPALIAQEDWRYRARGYLIAWSMADAAAASHAFYQIIKENVQRGEMEGVDSQMAAIHDPVWQSRTYGVIAAALADADRLDEAQRLLASHPSNHLDSATQVHLFAARIRQGELGQMLCEIDADPDALRAAVARLQTVQALTEERMLDDALHIMQPLLFQPAAPQGLRATVEWQASLVGLVEALATTGAVPRALQLLQAARTPADEAVLAHGYTALAGALIARGNNALAMNLSIQAFAYTAMIPDVPRREALWATVAGQIAATGHFPWAITIAQGIAEPQARAVALWRIANHLALAKRFGEAVALVEAIQEPIFAAVALAQIAQHLHEAAPAVAKRVNRRRAL